MNIKQRYNSNTKNALKLILQNHEGRANAITRRELRELLNYHDDRQLRLMIRELIAEGLPVISCTEQPAGYYLPLTWDELKIGQLTIKSYLIEEAKRLRDLKRAGALWLTPGIQRELF